MSDAAGRGERSVCLDARMAEHSGIGVHIRGLAEALHGRPGLPPMTFLGDPDRLKTYPYFQEGGPIRSWKARVYSAAEAWGPPSVSGAGAYHFPHYSVPQMLRPRRPFAVTIHDLIHLLVPEVGGPPLKRLAGRALMTSAVRRAAAVLTVSECSRRDISRVLGYPEEKILLTPNAVFPSFQALAPGEVRAVRAECGLLGRYVLSVGIDKAHKNLRFLVDAFLQWRRQAGANELELVICGAGPGGGAQLARYVAERGGSAAVRVLGPVRQEALPALYQAAEALVYPSLLEGFGLPLLEAQRVGTPVIASFVPSVRETAGDGALYFDPRSAGELSARLSELLEGGSALRTDLTAAGRENEKRFSWEKTAAAVHGVYGKLLQ